jgi:hypothetical protein
VTLKRVYTSKNLIMFYQGSLKDFAEVAMSRQILAACLEIAYEDALPYAISISPRDEYTYIRSFRVQPTTVLVRGMRRVAARLINTSQHSALVEWGGKPGGGGFAGRYRPAQHILLRTRDRITGKDGLPDADLAG